MKPASFHPATGLLQQLSNYTDVHASLLNSRA